MREIAEILSGCRVIPIVTFHDAATAVPVARALCEGGLKVIEVVLRTPAALPAIRAIARDVPEAVIGAGTVLNAADLDNSMAAGAAFVISPGSTHSLLALARGRRVPYLPAVATASELMLGMEEGYRLFKFFPAANLGLGTLKALAGPFAEARFCATGGVTRDNAGEFLSQPNVVTVGVSWVASPAAMAARDFAGIARAATEAARL